ncbi:MAG: hypothetical protein ACREAE_03170 [Nitrosopumilaceae archaeon]
MKYKQIIALLIRKTEAGRAKWRETSVKQQFSTKLESGTILIEPALDKTGNVTVFILSILNDTGDRVFSLTVSPLKEKDDFSLVSRLYDTIQRKHYKVDETLDSILDELKSDSDSVLREDDIENLSQAESEKVLYKSA